MKHLKLTLFENALDYLLKAAEESKQDTPRDWKYALLHLFAGIELLLKSRLELEHWTLLFSEVDKAAKGSLESGDFISVDFDRAIARLKNAIGIELKPETLRQLKELRSYRNKVQHFGISVDRETLVLSLNVGYDFALDFTRKNLAEIMSRDEGARVQIERMVELLNGFKDFVSIRMASIKPELQSAHALAQCPRCWVRALILGDGDPKCAYCGFSGSSSDVVSEILAEDGPVSCPECGGPCMHVQDAGTSPWLCFECGEGGDFGLCQHCGMLYDDDAEGLMICRECFALKVKAETGDQ